MIIMHIMLSIIIIYGYRPGPMTVSTRHRLPRNPLTCQRAFPPAHWMRTASTKQLRSSHSSDTGRDTASASAQVTSVTKVNKNFPRREHENQLENQGRRLR